MRWQLFAILGFLIFGSVAEATEGRVIKVLPLFLDLKGRESLSPSLYDRDAYQSQLRRLPRRTVRIAFRHSMEGRRAKTVELQLIVQVRGVAIGNTPKEIVLQKKCGSRVGSVIGPESPFPRATTRRLAR